MELSSAEIHRLIEQLTSEGAYFEPEHVLIDERGQAIVIRGGKNIDPGESEPAESGMLIPN